MVVTSADTVLNVGGDVTSQFHSITVFVIINAQKSILYGISCIYMASLQQSSSCLVPVMHWLSSTDGRLTIHFPQ